jgi:hypothetical protein
MRARRPDRDGFVDLGGVKLHWEVFGEAAPTLLLLPTWTIIHARSTRQVEDGVGWGLETSPEALIAEAASVWPATRSR